MLKPPFISVTGDEDKEAGSASVRARGNVDLGVMPVDDFAAKTVADIASKA